MRREARRKKAASRSIDVHIDHKSKRKLGQVAPGMVKFSTTRDLKVVPFTPVPGGSWRQGLVFEWSQFVVPAKDVETPVRVLPRTSPERQAVPLALRS